jgi:serine/threonine protein phosphatase PrpC
MMKGRVSPFKDLNGNLIGPMRVWCEKNDFPGLAMSRSFGDEIAHSVGVSDECEVREVELKDEDKFFVVGSDGLWEFMTGDEVTLIVKDFYFKDDSKGAVQKLFDESRRRWLREEDICDDITIIVGFFS